MRKILMMAVLAFLSLQGVGGSCQWYISSGKWKEETGSTGRYGQRKTLLRK